MSARVLNFIKRVPVCYLELYPDVSNSNQRAPDQALGYVRLETKTKAVEIPSHRAMPQNSYDVATGAAPTILVCNVSLLQETQHVVRNYKKKVDLTSAGHGTPTLDPRFSNARRTWYDTPRLQLPYYCFASCSACSSFSSATFPPQQMTTCELARP